MTSIEDYDHRHSTDNWAVVTYDKNRWIPMPGAFQGTPWANAAEWAFDEAGKAFLRGGRDLDKKVVKKEVLPFSELLLYLYRTLVGKMAAHKLYLNLPDHTKTAVGTYVGLWKCIGTREEAFDYYSLWGTRTAVGLTGLERTEAWTENLGTGIRTCFSDVVDGNVMYNVNYIFRNDEYNTDVHIYMSSNEEPRFREVLPELDVFVGGLRCEPDPANNGRVIGPSGV